MQTIRDFEIKRSGAFMTVTGKDEEGKDFRRAGFYSVFSMKLEDGVSAIVASHRDHSNKSVILGDISIPREAKS